MKSAIISFITGAKVDEPARITCPTFSFSPSIFEEAVLLESSVFSSAESLVPQPTAKTEIDTASNNLV